MTINPQEVQIKRQPRWEGWVPTYSGKGFRPITPKVSDVRLEDIAHGLAYKFRYGGQTEPVTIAEHSLLVSRIIETLWPKSGQMLAGLLHDACEAYTQDLWAPIRCFVKVAHPNGSLITWGDMERAVNQTIAKAFGIDQDFYSAPEVHAADILAVSIEKAQIPALQKSGSWGTPPVPPELSGLQIEYLSPQTACDAFVGRFHSLGGKD